MKAKALMHHIEQPCISISGAVNIFLRNYTYGSMTVLMIKIIHDTHIFGLVHSSSILQ